ncbi:uncharacterized protein LOC129595848 [Paramacrobiotus metropolitanus]|uniref:uncharacterized protein LOC129595848 n=1 Tax=Paramacrobiotus metropolitanus TaxID=2943436 RepID=UPI002445903B|nr:uncharacterized protein LOC129595848 [Paramacrobiotus metropolitanus]
MSGDEAAPTPPVGETSTAKMETEFMTPENTRMLIAIRTEMDERFRNNPKIGRNSLPDASDLWDELTLTYNSQYPDSPGRLPSCLKKRWEKLVSSYRKDTKFLVKNDWELKGRQLSPYFPSMDQSFRDKGEPEYVEAVAANPALITTLLESIENGQAYDRNKEVPKKRVRNKVPKFRRNPINPRLLDYEQPASAKLKNYRCIVPFCKNTARNTAYTKVRFIMLPRTNPAARRGYMDVIGVPYTAARDIFICSKHFPPEEVDLKAKYVVKTGTLPSLFLTQEEFDKEAADREADGAPENDVEEITTFMDEQPPSAWHTRKNFRCIVPSCHNRVRSVDWSKIRFSEIPMKGPKRRKYLEDCGLLDKLPQETLDRRHMLICTKHFEPKQIDFFRKPHVKAGEVPTLFLDSSGENGDDDSDDRYGKRSFFGKNASTPETVNRDIMLLELLVANNPFLPDRSQRDHKVRLQWEKIVTVYNAAKVEPLELTSRTCKNRVERFREKAKYNMVRSDPKYEAATDTQLDHIENLIGQVHVAASAVEAWEAAHETPREKKASSAHSVVYRCMVEGCSSRRVGRDDSDETRYYHVPNDPEIREIWLKAAGFYGCTANNTVMCSKHFEDECIKENGRLKKGSIPTVNIIETDEAAMEGGPVEDVEKAASTEPVQPVEGPAEGEEGAMPAEAVLQPEVIHTFLPSEFDTFDPKLKFGRHGLSQRHCVIAACPSHQNRLRQQKVGMFKCPQIPPDDADPAVWEQYQKWSDAISLENAYPWTHKHLICSAHFDDSMLRYHKTAGKVTLTKGAFPSKKLRSIDWPGTQEIMAQLMHPVIEEMEEPVEGMETVEGAEAVEGEAAPEEVGEDAEAAAEIADEDEGEKEEEAEAEEAANIRRSPRKRKASGMEAEDEGEKKETPKKAVAKKAKTPENVYEFEEPAAPVPSTSKSPRRSTKSSADFGPRKPALVERPATRGFKTKPAEAATTTTKPAEAAAPEIEPVAVVRKRGRPKRSAPVEAPVPETVNKRKRFSPRMVSREDEVEEMDETPDEEPAKIEPQTVDIVKSPGRHVKTTAKASEPPKSPVRAVATRASPKAAEAPKAAEKAPENGKSPAKTGAATKSQAKTKAAAEKIAEKSEEVAKAGKASARLATRAAASKSAPETTKEDGKKAEGSKSVKTPPEPPKKTGKAAATGKAVTVTVKEPEAAKPAGKAAKTTSKTAEPAKSSEKAPESKKTAAAAKELAEPPKKMAAIVEPVKTRAKTAAAAKTEPAPAPTSPAKSGSQRRSPAVNQSIQTRGARKNVVVRSPHVASKAKSSGEEMEVVASGSGGRSVAGKGTEYVTLVEVTATALEAMNGDADDEDVEELAS